MPPRPTYITVVLREPSPGSTNKRGIFQNTLRSSLKFGTVSITQNDDKLQILKTNSPISRPYCAQGQNFIVLDLVFSDERDVHEVWPKVLDLLKKDQQMQLDVAPEGIQAAYGNTSFGEYGPYEGIANVPPDATTRTNPVGGVPAKRRQIK
jgi:hypothetical protein